MKRGRGKWESIWRLPGGGKERRNNVEKRIPLYFQQVPTSRLGPVAGSTKWDMIFLSRVCQGGVGRWTA